MSAELKKSRDYYTYINLINSEEYLKIGEYNLFMVCAQPNPAAFRGLPEGYSFRLCRRDELDIWAKLAAGEENAEYVMEYYKNVYAKNEEKFFRRCMFVCDYNDKPVATCFIWRSYGRINTVAWLRTLPEYEGKGIGRALLSKLLGDTEYPVYLHTQPTSAHAIKLYSDFGFMLIDDDIIGYRCNHLQRSLPYLQKVLPKEDYDALEITSAPAELHGAALLSKTAEF